MTYGIVGHCIILLQLNLKNVTKTLTIPTVSLKYTCNFTGKCRKVIPVEQHKNMANRMASMQLHISIKFY